MGKTTQVMSLSVPPEMVDLFAQDSPQVAAPLLLHAQLDDQDWVRLIPGWPSTSRALVRERRDLPEETRRLLGVYGNVDFVLPGENNVTDPHESVIQIRDLVARIEAYRRDHRPAPINSVEPERLEFFRFEAGGDGIINWVEGAPRGPLIGISLADMAEPGGYGVDGQAAGACRSGAASDRGAACPSARRPLTASQVTRRPGRYPPTPGTMVKLAPLRTGAGTVLVVAVWGAIRESGPDLSEIRW